MKYFVTSKLSENIHETPEGFLVCIGVPIARTGDMLYGEGETPLETDAKGKVVISRSEDEVFRAETIASFEGKPVTITHPTEFVDPSNWSRLAKGLLQNVRRGEGENKNDLLADLLITDSTAIFLVKNGLREVSCGYEAEYTQTDEGKGIQTNIIGNHLALVDQGRAGSTYAINDHKGVKKMKLSERIKAIFAKAQDEAMKVAEDEAAAGKEDKGEKGEPAKDAGKSYDELVKMVKDLGEALSASPMAKKQKDAEGSAEAAAGEKEQKGAKDEDPMAALSDRLSALEASVSKLMEQMAGEGESEDADEDKKAKDADEGEESEESEDDDFEESTMTGDAASRVEILAPGMKPGKDAKVLSLKAAYATKDGKKVIDSLTGGKPTFDNAEKVETLFIAASELMKAQRSNEFSKAKQTRDFDSGDNAQGVVTAEKLNEINAKFYARN
jgi:hypothetical protein